MVTLKVSDLPQIFDGLKENTHKLSTWECDRLEEWSNQYEASKGTWVPSEGQMECIEKMWIKI